MSEAELSNMGTMGALSLFINFVGLFQNLLHLMGMSTDD
jgi:FtsH-binding integral membrane protein